jgi:tetratricopeptide (TPR) repeat protein
MKGVYTQRVVSALLSFLFSAGSLAAQEEYAPFRNGQNKHIDEARSLFADKKFDEALKQLNEAAKVDPLLAPANLMMARMMFAASQPSAGRQFLERALQEEQFHPECYLDNGSIALSEGRLAEAMFNLESALKYADLSRWERNQRRYFKSQAHAGLSMTYEMRRDWDSARKHLEAWLDLVPEKDKKTRARIYVHLAAVLNQIEDPDKNDATNEKELLALLKDATGAEAEDDNALTVGMAHVLGSIRYVDSKNRKANIEEADAWFRKAIERYPDDAGVFRAYAMWQFNRRMIDEAKTTMDRAEQIELEKGKKSSVESKKIRFVLAWHDEEYATARNFLDEWKSLTGPASESDAHCEMLILNESHDRDDRKQALKFAQASFDKWKESVSALPKEYCAGIGWVFLCSDKLEEAERALKFAGKGGQMSPDTGFYLATLYVKQKKYMEAYRLLKKAIESDGPFVNLKRAQRLMNEITKSG